MIFYSKNPFYLTYIYIGDHKIVKNWLNHNSTCTKLENLDDIFNQGQKIASFVSSVLARKLKCPSSAWLGLEPFQLGSAQLGKFQLEIITSS